MTSSSQSRIGKLGWTRQMLKWPFKKAFGFKSNKTQEPTGEMAVATADNFLKQDSPPRKTLLQNVANLEKSNFGQSKLVSFGLTWTIDNFSSYCEDDVEGDPSLDSVKFSAPTKNAQFFMILYPKGFSEEYRNDISLYLELADHAQAELDAIFKFSLLDVNGNKRNTRGYQRKFIRGQRGFGWHQFVTRADVTNSPYGLVHNDKLTIYCEVKLIETKCISKAEHWSMEQCGTVKDYSDLWQLALANQKLFDVELVVGYNDNKLLLHAHKTVLAARSPVFAGMFEHEMAESTHNRVEITDIEVEVFEELLKYFYFGKIDSLNIYLATKLLPLADKFQMDHLKSICDKFLCNHLCAESVLDILNLSKLHNSADLERAALDFINEEMLVTINSMSHQSLIEAFRTLVLEQEFENEVIEK